jgi:hypothetical protein
MTLLAPILLILLILIVRFAFSNMSKYLRRSKMTWMLGAYLVILLSSVVVYYLLPDNSDQAPIAITEQDIEQALLTEHNIYKAGETGEFANIFSSEGVYKNGHWTFQYDGDELFIVDLNTATDGAYMIIEQDPTNRATIEVNSYKTRTIVNGMDLTDKVIEPEVSLSNGSLIFTGLDRVRIETTQFKKDYTLLQFSKQYNQQGYRNDMLRHQTVFGTQLLHIRVPENVQIQEKTFANVYYIK